MTPMFVETQSSQGPESVAASQSGTMKGKLRATQTSLQFTQTQAAGIIIKDYIYIINTYFHIVNILLLKCNVVSITILI